MWEGYAEGYFPLRGRFSRSEQLRQTLSQNPEARYSMEEISVAEAFSELPEEMRERLASGEKLGE
jgi:NADH-quinone oxidoreductase subunit C